MKATLFETPPREKGGWGGGGLHEDRAKETASGLQNHLELRLGISLNNGSDDTVATTTSDGSSRGGMRSSFLTTPDGLHFRAANTWLPQSHTGFIHPWSLAARQQKAVLEQARHNSNPPPPPSSTMPRLVTLFSSNKSTACFNFSTCMLGTLICRSTLKANIFAAVRARNSSMARLALSARILDSICSRNKF